MKKLFLLFICCYILITTSESALAEKKVDYDSIYNNLPVLGFYYDQKEDPEEFDDYKDFVKSPYPLIRLSLKLQCKDVKLAPGYYLITPKSREGIDFAMFKQNGKIAAMLPIFEKQKINTEEIFPTPPPPKSKIKRAGKAIKNVISRPFNKYRKPPVKAPRYAVTSNVVDSGKYFELWLYKEDYLYKMLFKIIY